MSLTQTDLDAIDKAIASGELEVEMEGRRIKYRSVDELQRARRHVADVLASSGGATRTRASFQYQFTTQRGE